MADKLVSWVDGELITADKLNKLPDKTTVVNKEESGVTEDVRFNGTTDLKRTSIYQKSVKPDYYTTRYTGQQDMTVIGTQLIRFSGSSSDHSTIQQVDVRELNSPVGPTGALIQLPDKTHNLGHVNGVDFIYGQLADYVSQSLNSGYLVAYNGAGLPPEVTLFSNVTTDISFFDIANGTNIVFKEYNKTLAGDGSVSYGGDFKTLLLTRAIDTNHIGLRVIKLGTGSTDYSDKTSDKSDMTRWGTLKSGIDEKNYNGTAKIIDDLIIDTSELPYDTQPQGQTFKNGYLFMGAGFVGNHVLKISFHDGYGFVEEDLSLTDELDSGGETEGVAFYGGTLIVSARFTVSGDKHALWTLNLYDNTFNPNPRDNGFVSKIVPFSDINTVINNMTKYQGYYSGSEQTVSGIPSVGFFNMTVQAFFGSNNSGNIFITPTGNSTLHVYMGIVSKGAVTWKALDN